MNKKDEGASSTVTKKFRELTHADLGQKVQMTKRNGDKSTGQLEMIMFSDPSMIRIGGTQHSDVDADQKIVFIGD